MRLYAFTKNIIRLFLELTGISKKPIGLENLPKNEGYIIAGNHTSNFDAIRIGVQFPGHIRFLAKIELFKFKLFGAFLKKLGAISVDRGKADAGAIRMAEKAILDGAPLVIFPEGKRRKSFDRTKGKKGAMVSIPI